MSALYQDTAFRLSTAAVARLRDNAKRAGIPVPRYFRIIAGQLTRIANPAFDLSGASLIAAWTLACITRSSTACTRCAETWAYLRKRRGACGVRHV